jgi:hypothetical protein
MKGRLQHECVIASAGFHLLLGLVLLIGSAFLAPSNRTAVTAASGSVEPTF